MSRQSFTLGCEGFYIHFTSLKQDIAKVKYKSTVLVKLLSSLNDIADGDFISRIIAAVDTATPSTLLKAAKPARECLGLVVSCREVALQALLPDGLWHVQEEKLLCRQWNRTLQLLAELCRALHLGPMPSMSRVTLSESLSVKSSSLGLKKHEDRSFGVLDCMRGTVPADHRTFSMVLPEGISLAAVDSIQCCIHLKQDSSARSVVETEVVVERSRRPHTRPSVFRMLPSTPSVFKMIFTRKAKEERLPLYDELHPLVEEKSGVDSKR